MLAPLEHQQIRARVGEGAIDKVTRMFNASVADACVELLQNARRAGATRVSVDTEPLGGATRVTITDDGAGIADPHILLTFGDSDWQTGIVEAEDPAGMGLLSLSRLGCTIRWRTRADNGSPGPGYRLVLTPDHFLGRDTADVEPFNGNPWPHGTSVSFRTDKPQHVVQSIIEAAARHHPLPLTLDDEPIQRRAFLEDALHTEKWRGLVFGVYQSRLAGYNVEDVNFYGVKLPVRLPQINTIRDGTWSVRADIESCPELILVLPARKEAVETPFLDELRHAARLAIYRTMAEAAPAPNIAYKDWKRAAEAGIDLPVPLPELRPWWPSVADVDDWRDHPTYAPVEIAVPNPATEQALLVTAELEPPEEQTLYRAACRASIETRLFEVELPYAGFHWYDRLARIEAVTTHVIVDGVANPLGSFQELTGGAQPVRPEAINIDLHIARSLESASHGSQTSETTTIAADIVFAGEPWGWLDTYPLVTQTADLAANDLATLIVDAYFCPSDDADADSHETQRNNCRADAQHVAMKLLAGDDEALKHSIADAIWQDVLWRFPPGRDVEIRVRDRQVHITLGPPPASPRDNAPSSS